MRYFIVCFLINGQGHSHCILEMENELLDNPDIFSLEELFNNRLLDLYTRGVSIWNYYEVSEAFVEERRWRFSVYTIEE